MAGGGQLFTALRQDAIRASVMDGGWRQVVDRAVQTSMVVPLDDLVEGLLGLGERVEFYNTRRLHAGLKYLAPAEYWQGDPQARIEERNKKLEQAREIGRAHV